MQQKDVCENHNGQVVCVEGGKFVYVILGMIEVGIATIRWVKKRHSRLKK